jgi:hypothetical protein
MADMFAPSSGLLSAGINLKLNQIKLAARSYLRDRTHQATSTLTAYAAAAGLFTAAGIFLIGALFVGAIALFRWIEIHHGQFWAFGTVGGLLAVIACVCAGLAVIKLNRHPPHLPSLASRLRVAIKASPVKPDQIDAVRDTAMTVLQAPSSPGRDTPYLRLRVSGQDNRSLQAGLILTATLLGWAAIRRRQQGRHAEI